MERIIALMNEVDTTADCVQELNSNIRKANWKRKSKFNIKISDYNNSTTVRVFSDGIDTVSIINTEDGSFIINYDLNSIRPLINQIKLEAKKIYTYDYGEIFLNPWDMMIWVVGGDSGIIKTELSKSKLIELIKNGDQFSEDDLDIKFNIPEIKEVIVEAEFFPPMEKCDEYDNYKTEWIFVAKSNDLSDFDYD